MWLGLPASALALVLGVLVSPASAAWPPDCQLVEDAPAVGPDESWAYQLLRRGGSDLVFDFSHNEELDRGSHSIRATFLEWLLKTLNRSCFRGEPITIRNVNVSGDFLLTDTDLKYGLTIEWVTTDGTFRFVGNKFGDVRISQTNLLGHLDFSENKFGGQLSLVDNRGISVRFGQNSFQDTFTAANNTFDALDFTANLVIKGFNITNNSINQGMRVKDTVHVHPPSATHESELTIQITGNQIEGNFNFSPMLIDSRLDSVQLDQNMVRGAMRIELPFELAREGSHPLKRDAVAEIWDSGSLSLSNTTVASNLSMLRYFYRWLDPTMVGGPFAPEIFLNWSGLSESEKRCLICPMLYCEMWLHDWKDERDKAGCKDRCKNHTTQCAEGGSTLVIDLTNVSARAFEWGLEYDCNAKWHGPGFRYEHWSTFLTNWDRQEHGFVTMDQQTQPNALVSESAATGMVSPVGTDRRGLAVVDQIKAWRDQMWASDYESLNTIAAYLTRLGENVEARRYLLEARRQQHVGDFNPGETLMWMSSLPVSLVSAVGVNWEAFRDVILAVYLLPTGFGAQPEWALYLIIIMMMFGVALYKIYVYVCTPAEQRRIAIGLPASSTSRPAAAVPRDSPDVTLDQAAPAKDQIAPGRASVAQRQTPWRTGLATALTPLKKFGLLLAWFCVPDRTKSVCGFDRYDAEKNPQHLSLVAFSIDACLPVVNLNVYDHFYPTNRWVRAFCFFQRLWGWWMATVFVASATILA